MAMLHCGLLGRTLGHSYSPQLHRLFGDYEYRLYEVEPEQLPEFLNRGSFDALNVTIPYKKAVIPFCSSLSETARMIGSVNTLLRKPDGSLYGDNTDAYGFTVLLQSVCQNPAGKKALVFGSGGASLTVQYVLKKLGVSATVISRTGADNYQNLERHADAQMIVNATPLGMFPENGTAPCDLRVFPRCEAVIDLVYNPARTAFLMQAEALGIPCAGGLLMLAAQAKQAANLFTGTKLPDAAIPPAVSALERQMQNIILIGMPGCGKTTVGKALADALGRPFYDADAVLEQRLGMSIPDFFAKYGEDSFRDAETEVLRELGKQSGLVLATGGGCVTRAENYPLLHQNGQIIRVQRPLELLPIAGRPVSAKCGVSELYKAREPLYASFADAAVSNDGSISDCVNQILEVPK